MAAGTCELSPRIVPVAIFNTAAYVGQTPRTTVTGNGALRSSHIIGFFVEGMCNDVYPNQATRPPSAEQSRSAKTVMGRS